MAGGLEVDGVRDDLRDYVAENLGAPDGVLIVDDTGFLKRAIARRECSGSTRAPPVAPKTARWGVFLAYASARGHALIDRELYLPECWTADPDRCRAAGVPGEVEFATKPRQVMAMIERTLDAGVPFCWVTADEAYGQAKYLRFWLNSATWRTCWPRGSTTRCPPPTSARPAPTP